MDISKPLEKLWYGNHPLGLLLAPLSALYNGLVGLRQGAYAKGWLVVRRSPVPVIVIGNLSVGGTGKTPLVIAVAALLKARSYQPGIVARGYGGKAKQWPQPVQPGSDPREVGDEAILLARRSQCPVVVGPNRWAAAQALCHYYPCDIIVSDDGLQHLELGREIEIAVIDGVRRHGNGRCLPAGPLREPVSRLRQVDLIVTNGSARPGEMAMQCFLELPRSLLDPERTEPLADLYKTKAHAIAGIGHPERFFAALEDHGVCGVIRHPFPDHHRFCARDIHFGDGLPVLMTEKDAVKCQEFAGPEHWYVPVEARLPAVFEQRLLALIERRTKTNG